MTKGEFWSIISITIGEMLSWIGLIPVIKNADFALSFWASILLMGITVLGGVILTIIYTNLDD